MKMHSVLKFFAVFIVFAGLVYAGADLLKFTVRSQGGNVVISWQASSETNLDHYVVQRKTYNGSFIDIATVQPRADMNYEVTDASAYKDSETLYVYQLEMVDKNGHSSFSWEVAVPHNVSGVKRTWGSIKALFK